MKSVLVDFIRAKPVGAIGGVVVLLMLLSIPLSFIAPLDPYRTEYAARLLPPSFEHLFGTDELGRSVFSRVLAGTRLSLSVGFASTLLGSTLGALAGIISAYAGGRADSWIQRFMDILLSFPALVLAMVVVAVLGPAMINVIIAISVPFVPRSNRILRSAALQIKGNLYIEAARAIGVRPWRIVMRHIMPNCFAPYMVIATALLSQAIVLEATMSFLGLGVPPPAPSWGRSLADGMAFSGQAPWLAVIPGVALFVCVFAVNLLGDALRDTLDPKMKLR